MRHFALKLWGLHILLFPIALLIFFSPIIGLNLYDSYAESELKEQGDRVRKEIDGYRAIHGRFPASLKQAGIPNSGKPYFYYHADGNSYSLQCGLSVGVDLIYSSKTEHWTRQAY